MNSPVLIRDLGVQPYTTCWQAMQAFTAKRDEHTPDEIWLLQHPPVFTQGLNGKPEHLLKPGNIPVIPVDRGGQVTYHAPGQLILYLLLDLRRLRIGVRQLVSAMEQAVVRLLAGYDIVACARNDAPGVYVNGAKVASLGLRVRHGRCYHGLALNVDMDLEPFSRINPCGLHNQAVTRLCDLGVTLPLHSVGDALLAQLASELGITCLRAAQPHI